MPYISPQDRQHIETAFSYLERPGVSFDPIKDVACILKCVPSGKVKGAFNYYVTRLFCNALITKDAGYTQLSDAIAVLGDIQHELRRRLLDPYEDKVIEKNGDVIEFEEIERKRSDKSV